MNDAIKLAIEKGGYYPGFYEEEHRQELAEDKNRLFNLLTSGPFEYIVQDLL